MDLPGSTRWRCEPCLPGTLSWVSPSPPCLLVTTWGPTLCCPEVEVHACPTLELWELELSPPAEMLTFWALPPTLWVPLPVGTPLCKLSWPASESPSSFPQDSLRGFTCPFPGDPSCGQLGGWGGTGQGEGETMSALDPLSPKSLPL